MLVKAKCVTVAWDNPSATQYVPGGGPLPDGLYEIESDGPLAKMKLGSTYVFQFNRNSLNGEPRDYTCKVEGCGKKFKTLPELGNHRNSAHKDETPVVEDDEEEEEAADETVAERTCYICSPAKELKSAYGLRLHNEKLHPFQSQPEHSEAETTVPA